MAESVTVLFAISKNISYAMIACLRARCMSSSSYTGWQTEKPENLEEKTLGMAPKTLSREFLLH